MDDSLDAGTKAALELAKVLRIRLDLYFKSGSSFYFTNRITPLFRRFLLLGFEKEVATELTAKYCMRGGSIYLNSELVATGALARYGAGMSRFVTCGVAACNLLSWAFVMAQPAGAEGFANFENQLAYKNHIKGRVLLIFKASHISEVHARRVIPPMTPTQWWQDLLDQNPTF